MKEKKGHENREIVASFFEEALLADGFDHCILGVAEGFSFSEPVVIYDKELVLNTLGDSMSSDEAVEYYHFNILGSYVGEKTPIYMTTIKDLADDGHGD